MKISTACLLLACCVWPKANQQKPTTTDKPVSASASTDAKISAASPVAPVNVTNDWPYECAALKVYLVVSATDVRGYYMPVLCVPELSEYPGSILVDKSCVPGCVTEGATACWDSKCHISIR